MISQIWEATTAKRINIDPCLTHSCTLSATTTIFQRCIDYIDIAKRSSSARLYNQNTDTIRYDTIEEINVDSKAEYTA